MKSQIKNIKIYQKVIPTSYLAMFKSILQYYFKWVILKGKKKILSTHYLSSFYVSESMTLGRFVFSLFSYFVFVSLIFRL